MDTPGFEVTERLYDGITAVVLRATRLSDGLPVILKSVRPAALSPRSVARLQREYQILEGLHLAGVVTAYGFEQASEPPLLVMEDFGARALGLPLADGTLRFAGDQPLEVAAMIEFLRLAIQIAQHLGQLHEQHVIHHSINPANMVYNPLTQQVKLIDFGLATTPVYQHQLPELLEVLLRSLGYASPEQGGRLNRPVDHRSDLYALGVTYYELLTGHLPFEAVDPLELAYAHVAKQPPPPHELRPGLPVALSAIVLKLLSKAPENRYQAASSLVADLMVCLKALEIEGHIAPFPLGQHDLSDRFLLPAKLYGREAELAVLRTALNEARGAASQVVTFHGPPGIGATSIVQEFARTLAPREAYLATGCFLPNPAADSRVALTQAFDTLLAQVLLEKHDEIAAWRAEVLTASAGSGQTIVDMFPRLAAVFGPQPRLAAEGAEARLRPGLVFQALVKSLARPDRPLILMMDDMQCANAEALDLLMQMVATAGAGGLLLIGTYRVGTTDLHLRMEDSLARFRGAGAHTRRIELGPLTVADTTQLLADTLQGSADQLSELGAVVFAKTGGNPLILRQFLLSCKDHGLFVFDHQQGVWRYDLAQIQALQATPQVIDLMLARLAALPPQTLTALKVAACLDTQFALEIVARVLGESERDTAEDLWPASEARLILAVSHHQSLPRIRPSGPPLARVAAGITTRYLMPGHQLSPRMVLEDEFDGLHPEPPGPEQRLYRFAELAVQQALESLISQQDRQAIHWQIGCKLIESVPADDRASNAPALLEHLNRGRALVKTRDERMNLAERNLSAGQSALAAVMPAQAYGYFSIGLTLLHELPGEDPWVSAYDLTKELCLGAAQAAYRSADFEAAQRLTTEARQHAASLLDQVACDHIRMHALDWENRPKDAIALGMRTLRQLGVRLPQQPNRFNLARGLLRTRLALAGKRIADLALLPAMTDPLSIRAMEIMVTTTTLAAKAMPVLLPLIAFRQIQLSLRWGNHAFSAFGYAFYGLILCSITGEIELGYQFGDLAYSMLDRLEQRDQRAAVRYIVNATIRHWRDHIYDTLQPVRDVAENGEIEYLGIAAGLYSYHSYFISRAKIADSERAIREASDLLKQVPEASVRYRYEIGRQFYLNLLGRAENPCELKGEAYDEVARLPLHVEASDRTTVYYLACHKLILCYLFGNYGQARSAADLAAKYGDGGIGTPLVPVLNFYDSLTRLALYPTASRAEQRTLMKQVTTNQGKLRRWAHFGPANCQHKVTLVEAERARVTGRNDRARNLYEQAITQAQRQGYLPEEALAQELAGRFHVSLGLIQEGRSHLRAAHLAYDEWGATGKCRDLETQYPGFWAEAIENPKADDDAQAWLSRMLDMTSVMKAADAMSRRTLLPKLLENLTTVVAEHAGAQRGYLLIEKQGEWAVEAAYDPEQSVAAGGSTADAPTARLLISAVSQAAHTRTHVLIADAGRMREFHDDPLPREQRPKSILCLPLVNQGELFGVVYLENNLASDAFRPDRLELLNTLATQAAITVQNARFYAQLQEMESLERELQTARSIQRSFLPRNVPTMEGFQFGVIQEPARMVGGDFYDFIALDRDTLGIVVADVSDKGIPAALGMALTRSLLRAEASRRGQPAAVLRTVNLHLLEINDSGMFVTMLYGKLDRRTREFTYARAGHELPILFNAAGEQEQAQLSPGQPIGTFLDPLLDEGTLTIPEGGKLILTTDGVTDAINQAGEFFGEERLMASIRAGWQLSAQALCDQLLATVAAYQGDSPRFDDFTLMVIQAE